MTTNYTNLPDHMQDAARHYIEYGISPGGFLTAVLQNNLTASAACADDTNILHLVDWAKWVYNDIPSGAWGSPAKVDPWIAAGGLRQFEVTP